MSQELIVMKEILQFSRLFLLARVCFLIATFSSCNFQIFCKNVVFSQLSLKGFCSQVVQNTCNLPLFTEAFLRLQYTTLLFNIIQSKKIFQPDFPLFHQFVILTSCNTLIFKFAQYLIPATFCLKVAYKSFFLTITTFLRLLSSFEIFTFKYKHVFPKNC